MAMGQTLFSSFDRAGVPVERADRPIVDTNRDLFQLDIPRTPSERIRLWPGAPDNDVEVLSADSSVRQLVLRVREPRRPYEERIRGRGLRRERAEALARESGVRLLRPRGSSWIVERWTDPAERRFLIGFDQRHLFAAQVPSGDSVAEARDALMPPEVKAAGPGRVARQGEWFFVSIEPSEEREVRSAIASDRYALRKAGLGGFGRRAHWAEYSVSLPGRLYVRGTVHHVDHATVSFDRWRRVHLNAEVRRRVELARGFYWRD
jgi:hypothetical protein